MQLRDMRHGRVMCIATYCLGLPVIWCLSSIDEYELHSNGQLHFQKVSNSTM